jgi:F420H(2)-dependent quinone reductase
MALDAITRRVFPLFVKANSAVYRWTGGSVGGTMRGAPILLLTTTGRKSGEERTTPLLYLADGDRLAIVASAGGAPAHPGWYHNLRANPDVRVQIGKDVRPMRAEVAAPEERADLWPKLVALYGDYATYQTRTTREIPVVVLTPAAQPAA